MVLRDGTQNGARPLGHGPHDDEVTQALEKILDEPTRVGTRLDDAVDLTEHGRGIARREGFDDAVEQLVVGETQQARSTRVREALGPGARDELVEHRQRVTHRTAARARDERQHARLRSHALGVEKLLHVIGELLRRHEPERVVVRARTDGADDLLRLRGREDELHVLRRLLDDLEQGVEALRRHHVRLVDDVDLETAARRTERRALTQVAGVVDTTVRRGVDLDDVDRTRTSARQRLTRIAHPARRGRGALLAVEAAREDARGRRLSAPARAGEQVGVIDPPGAQCLHQRFGDVLLADDVGERLGAVAAVEGRCHGVSLVVATDNPMFPGHAGTGAAATAHHRGGECDSRTPPGAR